MLNARREATTQHWPPSCCAITSAAAASKGQGIAISLRLQLHVGVTDGAPTLSVMASSGQPFTTTVHCLIHPLPELSESSGWPHTARQAGCTQSSTHTDTQQHSQQISEVSRGHSRSKHPQTFPLSLRLTYQQLLPILVPSSHSKKSPTQPGSLAVGRGRSVTSAGCPRAGWCLRVAHHSRRGQGKASPGHWQQASEDVGCAHSGGGIWPLSGCVHLAHSPLPLAGSPGQQRTTHCLQRVNCKGLIVVAGLQEVWLVPLCKAWWLLPGSALLRQWGGWLASWRPCGRASPKGSTPGASLRVWKCKLLPCCQCHLHTVTATQNVNNELPISNSRPERLPHRCKPGPTPHTAKLMR